MTNHISSVKNVGNSKPSAKSVAKPVKAVQGFSLNSIKSCERFVVERNGRIVIEAR